MLKRDKRGILVVISSPSGAGKTTIVKKLALKKKQFDLSVSLTTRKPRLNEVSGIDYVFVSKKIFNEKVKKKLFLEYANVFGNFYGTLKSDIFKKIKSGKNILLDIDWQGARQVRKKFPDDIVSIFILPPSLKELRNRLKKRGSDLSFVNQRMNKASKEIVHWKEYDYAVVNDNLNKCLKKIKKIISLDSYRPNRQKIIKYQKV